MRVASATHRWSGTKGQGFSAQFFTSNQQRENTKDSINELRLKYQIEYSIYIDTTSYIGLALLSSKNWTGTVFAQGGAPLLSMSIRLAVAVVAQSEEL